MGDIFELHRRVIEDYRDFVQSFLHIQDERLREFVQQRLSQDQELWPDVLAQVSPGYTRDATVEELADRKMVHPETAEIFRDRQGRSYHLYTHQTQAIRLALEGRSFVLTSGTGSGKSLCFFLPIIDSLLRNPEPSDATAALVVYPMNALVNSQVGYLKELKESYEARTGRSFPIRFARYTGETVDDEERQEIRRNPPHLLLTNYMMAELMLTRPEDGQILRPARNALRFLVFDELHTYRGRQGADVAMLIRRLKAHCGVRAPVHIGTSATLVAAPDASGKQRRETVAGFASKLFGCDFGEDQIIEESLAPLSHGGPPTDSELSAALQNGFVPRELQEFWEHPVVRWLEHELGIYQDEEGRHRRRPPQPLSEAAERLAQRTGLDRDLCNQRLKETLAASAAIAARAGSSIMPFKLHQFLSQGRPLQATLEPADRREFSLEGQVQASESRLLAPVRFCRVCGQDYYEVERRGNVFVPPSTGRSPEDDEEESDWSGAGYLMLAREGEAGGEDLPLPEEWYDNRGRLRSEWRRRKPELVVVRPDGTICETQNGGGVRMWWQRRPFSLCLNCGEFYRGKMSEYRKLAGLSTEGRSTATSILATSLLRHASVVDGVSEKLLTFTDNRQDASLQAGHFNDFVRTAMLRSALCAALRDVGEMDAASVAPEVVKRYGLTLQDIAKNPSLQEDTDAARKVCEAFEALTTYRLYQDLRGGWSLLQPGLEEVGLLKIRYFGLSELAARDTEWASVPAMRDRSPAEREEILQALLDHFRRKFAIEDRLLQENERKQLMRRCEMHLNEFWGLDSEGFLEPPEWFCEPGSAAAETARGGRSLSFRSAIGQFLKRELGLTEGKDYERVLKAVLERLIAHDLLRRASDVREGGLRVSVACLQWCPGDGTPPPPDPVRRRRVEHESYSRAPGRVNTFYQRFYQEPPERLAALEAREHTAQVVARGEREYREHRFRLKRNGGSSSPEKRPLPYLVCSPTMELGVDIADLEMVHMRNVPPTPANYAQRSGRAGRQGQPGLIVTYCGATNPHDQYYFRRRSEMVAGSVRAPRLDIANEALLEAHIHAVWLGHIRLPLGRSVEETLDIEDPDLPLKEGVRRAIHLSDAENQMVIAKLQTTLGYDQKQLEACDWFDTGWLERVVKEAPEKFDRAFDRWRELYRAALSLRQEGRRLEDVARSTEDRERAIQRQREAGQQIALLLQQDVSREESDFYPYRYLASEGFLPGYNFPALPVRAWVPRGEGEFISRPRFVAIREFAPGSVLYHEGARWWCKGFYQPPGGLEKRLSTRRLCKVCSSFWDEGVDICNVCETRLSPDNSEIATVLEMPNVRTQRRERINSGVEEREAGGFEIETFIQTSAGDARRRSSEAVASLGDSPLLRLTYTASATVLRINRGRRGGNRRGFRVNLETGEVMHETALDMREPGIQGGSFRNVNLAVQGTHNLLRISLEAPELREDRVVEASLQYALKRGIELEFELEESELEAERLGSNDQRSIVFLETGEGGAGVLRRLIEEPDALNRVAKAALGVCHYAPDGSDNSSENGSACLAACYECLMSFNNQQDALNLDRRKIRDILLKLAGCSVDQRINGRSRQEHLQWLLNLCDLRSDLEKRFLRVLEEGGFALPHDAQRKIEEPCCIPDFFYKPNICVFCDGSVHDEPEQAEKDRVLRSQLREAGYDVVVIRYDSDILGQIRSRPDIFGVGRLEQEG